MNHYMLILHANQNGKHSFVYRLKSVGALKIKFVAPMPEQITTPTMHFSEVSRDLTKKHCYGPNSFWHGCNES